METLTTRPTTTPLLPGRNSVTRLLGLYIECSSVDELDGMRLSLVEEAANGRIIMRGVGNKDSCTIAAVLTRYTAKELAEMVNQAHQKAA
jgi:hypothetical protein